MNKKWQVNPKVLSSKIDEEAILMSLEAEAYFGLEPIGSRIWELLSKNPLTTDEVVVVLMKEYEVIKTTCSKHVQQFIDDMLKKKLVHSVAVSA